MIRNDLQLPPGEVCWPELFQEAGRATHYVGKWRLDGPDKLGFVPFGWRRRGFATFEGFNRGHVYHELGGVMTAAGRCPKPSRHFQIPITSRLGKRNL